ncbi:MAG: carotenoid 1,2-hydratase [Phenylobacterium sp.]|nr:carotenoid 1,2-hydratase [Phenylobacterium sp.]
MSPHASSARFADRPEDFAKLGIKPGEIEPFEDGMRTEGGPGGYEWWYFDSHLSDGSSLVIVFFTKGMMNPAGKLAPFVTVELDRPGRPTLHFEARVPPRAFLASRDRCDVRIGGNRFRGDLHDYEIHFAHGDVTIDVKLTGEVPAWRPTSGHMYFGEHDEHFFAWLPAVPQGKVSVDLNIRGEQQRLEGVGYHDHNWGDAPMMKLINHWYWGRAQAGDYSIVASYIFAEKAYGGAELPIFMLAKRGKIIADDARKVRFHLQDEHIDRQSGKPVANLVIYDYEDGPQRYRVTYRRAQTIVDSQLITRVSGFKRVLATLARFDGSYLRFTGAVQLQRFVGGDLVEDVSDPGIWEMMYFGRVRR